MGQPWVAFGCLEGVAGRGLPLSPRLTPISRPQNGSVILYNRKKVKYRKDGYCWKKRKDGKTTREDHMKLKVQGVEVGGRGAPQKHQPPPQIPCPQNPLPPTQLGGDWGALTGDGGGGDPQGGGLGVLGTPKGCFGGYQDPQGVIWGCQGHPQPGR